MAPSSLRRAADVVAQDLDYICDDLADDFARMAGRNLLIVGGAGFLGYYLVQSVAWWNRGRPDQEQVRLTVFDNFSRGRPEWLANLSSKSDSVTLRRHDIRDPLPDDIGDFDYILHAASIASPTYYRKDPIGTMDGNVNGLRTLLDYFLAQKEEGKAPRGFLFFSSSEIYGDPTPENIPTPEDYWGNVSSTGPRACYDESKRYGETLCVNFARQHDLPVVMVRPFNNYGPGLKITDRRVLPDFAGDVLDGRDIVLLSDGTPTRTFCYVADAVCGYYRALTRGRPGEPYNIGVESPEISMRRLAEMTTEAARHLFGYGGRVVVGASDDEEYLTDNPNRRCPVIRKAREELGYRPGVELTDGIRRSLVWYRDNATAEDS
jgi:nucleoside-diphosphate-sugar epimerase